MESYQRLIDIIAIENLQMRVEHWFLTELLVWSSLQQLVIAVGTVLVAYLLSRPLIGKLVKLSIGSGMSAPATREIIRATILVAFPGMALILLLIASSLVAGFGGPNLFLRTCVNLLAAWVVIRLISRVIRNDFWSRTIAIGCFAVATLNTFHMLSPAIVYLDQAGIRLGDTHISVLDILRGAIQVTVFVWLAMVVSRLLERRLQDVSGLTPSLRVLTSKLLRFSLVTLALVAALSSAGIDLTAFALFTGALGVGIGFGLQKPISNLISGLIILFDRSIKPGDVVELSDPNNRSVQLFGWVTALNARYVSLTTRDGTEWLVPNEDLISNRIINWSYSHNRLRLLTPIGVSFECDVELAMQLAEEAAGEHPRVLNDPAPVCRLMGFSDSTVKLEMRFWIDDPTNGVINVRSAVLVSVWRKFREHGIRTPLAHRDVLIKGDSALKVHLQPDATNP